MESYDPNTRLPPRKRLLAGAVKDDSDSDFAMPVAPVSSDLYSRLRHLFNSASSSQEEMIEGSRVTALATAEAAAKARVIAMEKAAAAAGARAAAKRALELLDSVSRIRARREGGGVKKRGKTKHVAVKNLYMNKGKMETDEVDKELARRFRRARVSDESVKQHLEKVAISDSRSVCNETSPADHEEEAKLINRESKDKSEEGIVMRSKLARGVKDRGTMPTKKMKGKRKRLLVSQCGIGDQGKHTNVASTEEPKLGHAVTEGPKLDHAQRNIPLGSAKPSSGDEASMKMPSVFKCKKIKLPLHSSDSKIPHTLFSDPTAPKASVMVEVD